MDFHVVQNSPLKTHRKPHTVCVSCEMRRFFSLFCDSGDLCWAIWKILIFLSSAQLSFSGSLLCMDVQGPNEKWKFTVKFDWFSKTLFMRLIYAILQSVQMHNVGRTLELLFLSPTHIGCMFTRRSRAGVNAIATRKCARENSETQKKTHICGTSKKTFHVLASALCVYDGYMLLPSPCVVPCRKKTRAEIFPHLK